MINVKKSEKRFFDARMRVLSQSQDNEGIGRLNEKTLHKILKFYLEPQEEYHEVKFLGKIADIKNESGIFEIQPRAMEKMNSKLKMFLESSSVTLVIPLAAKKTVSWVDGSDVSKARKSPKSEGIFDALYELSKISLHFGHENLRVKLLYLDLAEYRYLNGWDKTGKRGSTRCDRIPNRIISEIDIFDSNDILSLLGPIPDGEFLAKDFAKITKKSSRKNYYILRFLQDVGLVFKLCEEKHAFVYKFR